MDFQNAGSETVATQYDPSHVQKMSLVTTESIYRSRRSAFRVVLVTAGLLVGGIFWGSLIIPSTQAQDFPTEVRCEGSYPRHLQGICVDNEAVYWSFTTTLVKTDWNGKLLAKVPVANHHGDLCQHGGKLYVAVNLGKFNDPKGNADSWVYVYDASTLEELAQHEIQEAFHGAGGIGFRDGHFFVVGGLPIGVKENYVYEYDVDFKLIQKHVLQSGHTHLGIQTATFANNRWWFGCYGTPKILLVTSADLQMEGRHEYDCSLGIIGLPDGRFLSASGKCEKDNGCIGIARAAVADEEVGLRLVE